MIIVIVEQEWLIVVVVCYLWFVFVTKKKNDKRMCQHVMEEKGSYFHVAEERKKLHTQNE